MSKGLGKLQKEIIKWITENRVYEGKEYAPLQSAMVKDLMELGYKRSAIVRAVISLEDKGLIYSVTEGNRMPKKLIDIYPITARLTRSFATLKLVYKPLEDYEKCPDLKPYIYQALKVLGYWENPEKLTRKSERHRLSRIFKGLFREDYPQFFFSKNQLFERVSKQYYRTLKKILSITEE